MCLSTPPRCAVLSGTVTQPATDAPNHAETISTRLPARSGVFVSSATESGNCGSAAATGVLAGRLAARNRTWRGDTGPSAP